MKTSNYYSKVKALMFTASSKFTHSVYSKDIVQPPPNLPNIKSDISDGVEHDKDQFTSKFNDRLQNDDILSTNEKNPIQRE